MDPTIAAVLLNLLIHYGVCAPVAVDPVPPENIRTVVVCPIIPGQNT